MCVVMCAVVCTMLTVVCATKKQLKFRKMHKMKEHTFAKVLNVKNKTKTQGNIALVFLFYRGISVYTFYKNKVLNKCGWEWQILYPIYIRIIYRVKNIINNLI